MELSLKPTVRTWLIAAFGVVLIQALVLILFGQPLTCECGTIRLWAGQVLSPENSQQITDWYTFSHIIHGFLLRIDLPYLRPEKPTKLGLHHFLKTMPKRNPESNEFLDSSNSLTPPISFPRQ
jgi:hypothetical protein